MNIKILPIYYNHNKKSLCIKNNKNRLRRKSRMGCKGKLYLNNNKSKIVAKLRIYIKPIWIRCLQYFFQKKKNRIILGFLRRRGRRLTFILFKKQISNLGINRLGKLKIIIEGGLQIPNLKEKDHLSRMKKLLINRKILICWRDQ